LATLMVSIPNLRTLLVDSNNLCDVSAIGTCLFTNTTLTTLGLSHNNIGSDSILTFARALVINTTLMSLDLSSNLLTEEVSMPLLNALSCNTVLTRLCVLGNPELAADTILNLTLPKPPKSPEVSPRRSKLVSSQPSMSPALSIRGVDDDGENGFGNAGTPLLSPVAGVVGNAGHPLISPGRGSGDFFEEVCEKCKIERLARRKQSQPFSKCTHIPR